MSKAILISIKPKWVAKILNGEKTIEIRKTKPNVDLPVDVYIYCTKDKDILCLIDNVWNTLKVIKGRKLTSEFFGKVLAKFTLNKVEKITPEMWSPIKEKEVLNSACLNEFELLDYISKNNGEPDNPFYAWHISNLVIFDKPKELSEFRKYSGVPHGYVDEIIKYTRKITNNPNIPLDDQLTKAPQSWQFIETGEQRWLI